MSNDLKSYCESLTSNVKEHFRPWTVLALIAYGGSADLKQLSDEYEQYEKDMGKVPKAISAKRRFRGAVHVLEAHGVVQLAGNLARLVAPYRPDEVPEIERFCHEALRSIGLPRPTFVSGGLPSHGTRR